MGGKGKWGEGDKVFKRERRFRRVMEGGKFLVRVEKREASGRVEERERNGIQEGERA